MTTQAILKKLPASYCFPLPANEASFKRKWREMRKNSSLKWLYTTVLCNVGMVRSMLRCGFPQLVLEAWCKAKSTLFLSWAERTKLKFSHVKWEELHDICKSDIRGPNCCARQHVHVEHQEISTNEPSNKGEQNQVKATCRGKNNLNNN